MDIILGQLATKIEQKLIFPLFPNKEWQLTKFYKQAPDRHNFDFD